MAIAAGSGGHVQTSWCEFAPSGQARERTSRPQRRRKKDEAVQNGAALIIVYPIFPSPCLHHLPDASSTKQECRNLRVISSEIQPGCRVELNYTLISTNLSFQAKTSNRISQNCFGPGQARELNSGHQGRDSKQAGPAFPERRLGRHLPTNRCNRYPKRPAAQPTSESRNMGKLRSRH